MGAQLSLYETLGGERALEAVVVRFYRRVLADPRLKPFFAGADMTRLKAMQRAFLAMALGGRGRYSGPSLDKAHAPTSWRAASTTRTSTASLSTLRRHSTNSAYRQNPRRKS